MEVEITNIMFTCSIHEIHPDNVYQHQLAIIEAKKADGNLNDLLNEENALFKNLRWRVLFSDVFKRSFEKLTSSLLKQQVLQLLLKLSAGWRPKNRSVGVCFEESSQQVEDMHVIFSVDIIKEFNYIQAIKVWDVLRSEDIPKLTKRLEFIFSAYTDDYISRCTEKLQEGNCVLPKSWPTSQEIIKFQSRKYVENANINDSLLLMKFYPLSPRVVHHLISGDNHDLPVEVTDEQMNVILFTKSSFIMGRSGTGKTIVLTRKLLLREQNIRVASKAEKTLRQVFVTVNPRLCAVVKHHLSQLTSILCPGAEFNPADADSELSDIPNTLAKIPVKRYPLVITFQKFLLMLDGTLGSSYFDRFLEERGGSHGGSVALEAFIGTKEVTFDRFHSDYWPHFNSKYKKKLDSSRVFTEIISHIKGGLQTGETSDGRLSYAGYSALAESRISTLTKERRQNVYSLFQAYENMKMERGEFDWADVVIDLHHRLKNAEYKGDKMDFIYIDEVQDLSMGQISLFKYICQNASEAFVFAGDTAQTVARGIDFRFQDIRSMFYKEFLPNEKEEKGLVSKIFQLKQNFRTHAGVLNLAHSVIELVYHYFPQGIDILDPETSLVYGELPVLLEPCNGENAMVTIFGGNGSTNAENVGFGAEQVILARDDDAKKEIYQYVGKQALVLTVLESKGLEFQDVLLYNFFGASPLKDQWRVIYEYMKKHDWLDEEHPESFPTFSLSRHSVLCYELKQLYVAITRTRQRLWIFETKDELSKPMFNYWKRRGLAQIRKLDDSMAQAMRVASSPQEWRERGIQLMNENNFDAASLCFERAGDTGSGILGKTAGLRADADNVREEESGDVLEHASLLEKAGLDKEAANLLISHAFLSSLWGKGNMGWPLKQFDHNKDVCEKAKLLANKTSSEDFCELVCSELRLLSHLYTSLPDLKKDLKVSRKNKSLRGEILFTRMIIDWHLKAKRYLWEDKVPADLGKHCKNLISQNHCSVRTLVYYWNSWREQLLKIFICLESFHGDEPNQHEGCVGFLLDFFGVKKQNVKDDIVYMPVDMHATWIRKAPQTDLHRDQKTTNVKNLVSPMMYYWQNEFFSVSQEVLVCLKELYDYKAESNGSPFQQSTCLLLIFEVSKCLLECKYVKHNDKKRLERSLPTACLPYMNLVFPLDCRSSVFLDLISLRETDLSLNLLEEITHWMVNQEDHRTNLSIGWVMMLCVSTTKRLSFHQRAITRVRWSPAWASFLEKFQDGGFKNALKLIPAWKDALEDHASMPIYSYVHLLECFTFMVLFLYPGRTRIYSARSAFLRWLTHIHSTSTYQAPDHMIGDREPLLRFIEEKLENLYCCCEVEEWMKKSGVGLYEYYPILMLRVIMMFFLLCLHGHFSVSMEVTLQMVKDQRGPLPKALVDLVDKIDMIRNELGSVTVSEEKLVGLAFECAGDPLVAVCLENDSPGVREHGAYYVDLGKSKEEIMSVLSIDKSSKNVDLGKSKEEIMSVLSIDKSSKRVTKPSKKEAPSSSASQSVEPMMAQMVNSESSNTTDTIGTGPDAKKQERPDGKKKKRNKGKKK